MRRGRERATYNVFETTWLGYDRQRGLSLEKVDFENDATISALASGLEGNYSLFILGAYECNLLDAQVVELVESFECHPLFIILDLGGNHACRRAVAALVSLLEESGLERLHFPKQSRRLSPGHIQVLSEALEGNEYLEVSTFRAIKLTMRASKTSQRL
jgi:hypothetical protein